MLSSIVRLNNIKVSGTHGIYDSEKITPQIFEIDMQVFLPEKKTFNDNIANSINYEEIYHIIVDIVSNNTFNLLETLGEHILERVLQNKNVLKAIISIKKPDIKFGDNVNCVEVLLSKVNE